ncbi:GNAT family N-acetyltransferase [Crassaminicella profunda]|uniref:GNAT family N-acetyltransferase n=1 Tax=Crassaminicella profunda TaxID=1286698 RepID=UPI001CA7A41A|nr:GNAT family N-acetyltransferase [Crassaminicella profunda]QZY53860.1 GNAT family N-acetyltransferase [Crassaminicella profunda]
MIRKSTFNDIEQIMDIIRATIEEMGSYGNHQWDTNYPIAKDFIKDIENYELYTYDLDGQVAGFVCINHEEPIEYKDVNWSSPEKFMVIHRMAINHNYRNQGIGTQLIKFAEELARNNQINYLKTDTYSINLKMNSLFKKLDFNHVGNIKFLGRQHDFYCYEKILG